MSTDPVVDAVAQRHGEQAVGKRAPGSRRQPRGTKREQG